MIKRKVPVIKYRLENGTINDNNKSDIPEKNNSLKCLFVIPVVLDLKNLETLCLMVCFGILTFSIGKILFLVISVDMMLQSKMCNLRFDISTISSKDFDFDLYIKYMLDSRFFCFKNVSCTKK